MAKRKAPQAGADASSSSPPSEIKLTWEEERFVEALIDTKGNVTQAGLAYGYSPTCASQRGRELANKSHIQEAVALKREEWQQKVNFDREKYLRILIGMATARQSDFAKVLTDPSDRDNYVGLGDLEYAIKSARMTDKGNEIQMECRMGPLNELRDFLGLAKDKANRRSPVDDFFGAIEKLRR